MKKTTTHAMTSKIGLWGGSCAVRLPKVVVESLGLKEGDNVSLQLEGGALVIRPSRQRYTLDQLVAEASTMTPPPAPDDAPLGDEAL